jgi:hypothetical protein
MREPLTAKLDIDAWTTRVAVCDARGRHLSLDVMPELVPYDGDDEQIAAAFRDAAESSLVKAGLERAGDWAPAYEGALWEYTTTLRAASAEEG